MLVLAGGAILQALSRGPVGSGFVCQPVPTAIYLVPSLLAARHGGLSLVFGMTILAGLFELMLARGLRHLRPLFPPEVAGLVIFLIGMITGAVGARTLLGVNAPVPLGTPHAIVAVLTLGTIVFLNVWTRGSFRLFCVLIGMIVGYIATAALGGFDANDLAALRTGAFVALPRFEPVGWSFDIALVVPFAVAAVAASLKTVGNVTTCQKLNDADWTRADMRSISRGVAADGLATMIAGAAGTSGVNSSTMNVGLANATGVLSRRVAYAVAGLLVVFAFLPKFGVLLYLMPPAVAGAALLFAASFIIVSGFEIMTSRLFDARRVFVVGFAVIGAQTVDLYPSVFSNWPALLQPFIGSSLVLGTLTALLLNIVFRIGVRQTQSLVVMPGQIEPATLEAFMETAGAAWGARRDVIDRASFNLSQSIEVIAESCEPQSPLEIAASFDEFNLDVRVSYTGAPLELPDRRPSNEEIIASDEGQRKLAGFMLRRHADRVAATHKAGRSTVFFHFDH